ncbi:hypothetical protein ACHAW5_009271 [Stephanodiscus triporus]|uniref:Peptidase M43 pregnancy-associated plasma-A domain-containing protein n=1 Tax=Stephanodiscus triporus TaxID=2934178 RepID=A0ABD3N257_9STRA
MMLRFAVSVVCSMHLHSAIAHGEHKHHHDRPHHDRDDKSDGTSRRLENIFENNQNRKFTVGGVSYKSREDFFQSGGRCLTPRRTSEEEDEANNDFKAWKEAKETRKEGGIYADRVGGRRLVGCGDNDCVDWNKQVITVPVQFHVIHDGETGRQYTYESNRTYIERSIKALNFGFQGIDNTEFTPFPNRSYSRYNATEADSKIRFCLAGTTATNNSTWYYAGPLSADFTAMKEASHVGDAETLNVWATQLGGYWGHATLPPNDSARDGVAILNELMPGGPQTIYSEGDTLTHEVGHWLGLKHTHDDGCTGVGDYMIPKANEATSGWDCPVGKDDCSGDGGRNPIHNFMSFYQDNCVDQFTPGQNIRMQSSWEMYRHRSFYSEAFTLAADGFSCVYNPLPTSIPTTSKPTMKPTTSKPTMKPKRPR